jgi:uncharacterized delta-60 repeat protein
MSSAFRPSVFVAPTPTPDILVVSEQILLNGVSNTDITNFILNSNLYTTAKIEYSILKKYNKTIDGTTPLEDEFILNAIESSKFNNFIRSVFVQDDGKVLVGGAFTDYDGEIGRDCLVRLNSNGTVDTAFCANAVDSSAFGGSVYAILQQPDGKILVGGDFIAYKTSGRNFFIRLNADGTLDTTFCANATDGGKFTDSYVASITLQSDGKILVGGLFNHQVAGRNNLIRLNADGTLDSAFTTLASVSSKFNGAVLSTAVHKDFGIIVGGAFTNYNSATGRDYLIKLNQDGSLNTTFTSTISDGGKFEERVRKVLVQADNKVVIGGANFAYDGNTNASYLVRFSELGVLDTNFLANAGGKFNNDVNTIILSNDDGLVIGGKFTNHDGTTGRNRLVKLLADGLTDNEFCNNYSDSARLNGELFSIAEKNSVDFIVGGDFTNYQVAGRDWLAFLDKDLDRSFITQAIQGSKIDSTVSSIAIQSDGKILLGGYFVDYAGLVGRNYLVRLLPSGIVDLSFCAQAVDGGLFTGGINQIIVQTDGKILLAGDFIDYVDPGRNYLVRLNADGTLDTVFCANASDGSKFSQQVTAIAVQSNGAVIAGGDFTDYDSEIGRDRLIRLSNLGVVDTVFCSNASDGSQIDNIINTVVLQADEKILVGGQFADYGGTLNRDYLIRLEPTGETDITFCNNAVDSNKFSSFVLSVAAQPDGKIIVGGQFADYLTADRDNLVRLNADGTLDTVFCANASDNEKFKSTVLSIYVQPDNKILIGGLFTNYDNVTNLNRFVRLNNDGTTDLPFTTNAASTNKFNGGVYSLAYDENVGVFIGGDFNNYAFNTSQDKLTLLGGVTPEDSVEQGSMSAIYRSKSEQWSFEGRSFAGNDNGVEFYANTFGQVRYSAQYDVNSIDEIKLKWTTIKI